MGLRLPFNAFVIEVLKHLVVVLPQLHPTNQAYVKVFKYLCEYLKGRPYFTLFFHLFRSHHEPATQTRDKGLVSLVLTVWSFDAFSKSLPHFEDRFYFVSSIRPEAHATVCAIRDRVKGKCDELFPKYQTETHFLMRNRLYVYKKEYLSH